MFSIYHALQLEFFHFSGYASKFQKLQTFERNCWKISNYFNSLKELPRGDTNFSICKKNYFLAGIYDRVIFRHSRTRHPFARRLRDESSLRETFGNRDSVHLFYAQSKTLLRTFLIQIVSFSVRIRGRYGRIRRFGGYRETDQPIHHSTHLSRFRRIGERRQINQRRHVEFQFLRHHRKHGRSLQGYQIDQKVSYWFSLFIISYLHFLTCCICLLSTHASFWASRCGKTWRKCAWKRNVWTWRPFVWAIWATWGRLGCSERPCNKRATWKPKSDVSPFNSECWYNFFQIPFNYKNYSFQEDAIRLYQSCKRYDLVNRIDQATNNWKKVIF